eukprot:110449-Alexandrium_andersonii.AAC.1
MHCRQVLRPKYSMRATSLIPLADQYQLPKLMGQCRAASERLGLVQWTRGTLCWARGPEAPFFGLVDQGHLHRRARPR